MHVRPFSIVTACLLVAASGCATMRPPAHASSQPSSAGTSSSALPPSELPSSTELPLKHAPTPTTPAITAADLLSRLYVYADDSMLGRQAGLLGSVRATNYIAAELARMGLEPAGDSGTYFQAVPFQQWGVLDSLPTLSVAGKAFELKRDYDPFVIPWFMPHGGVLVGRDLETIYGGRLDDTTSLIPVEAGAGKVVVVSLPMGAPPRQLFTTTMWDRYVRSDAVGVVVVAPDIASAELLRNVHAPFIAPHSAVQPGRADHMLGLLMTPKAAELVFGESLAQIRPGAAGKRLDANIRFVKRPAPFPARNVVAILRGTDPTLRGQYVAIGAHSDHIGFNEQPIDHDSLRAINTVFAPRGIEATPLDGFPLPLTETNLARLRSVLDSLRRLHSARLDSIANGADDDGSGTVGVLEVAEAFATRTPRPRRSLLFLWHTGEESGLIGSRWFVEHPTVPRDSIVAELNIDMIGRGDATDLVGATTDGHPIAGNPDYLQLVGSRRLSTELGDLVERVNANGRHGFRFDYSLDANGHPSHMYCRSDHYSYARYGVPIVFFTTGVHRDYHQFTDEPQYIDYSHFTRVVRLIYDVVDHVANLDHRVVVDQVKPDPKARCEQ